MLASVFISQGVKALRDPEQRADEAEMVNHRLTPLLERYAPASVVDFVPEKNSTWARVIGLAQVLGGLGLATGIGRRGGATMLALTNIPTLVANAPTGKKSVDGQFLTQLALTGAVALAAQDTQGKPSMAYRAQLASARVERGSKRTLRRARREADALGSDAQKAAKRARKQVDSAGKKARGALTR